MLKKTAAVVFAAAWSLAPAQTAAAWNEVCVKFPLWKTAFVGHFTVVHDHHMERAMPRRIPDRGKDGVVSDAPKHTITRGSRSAREGIHSGNFAANQSRCVDIRRIPEGRPFAVYVRANGVAHCATHESNPRMYYKQRPGKFRHNQIWFEGWGVDGYPSCKFSHTR